MSTSGQSTVIWGEVLWDLFPDGPQLGGAPANVAWHLGLAGGWARLVSRVGDDKLGQEALTRLGEVCDTSLVQIDPSRKTGIVEVALAGGEPSYRLVPDRAWQFIECTHGASEAIAEASVFVYGTLAQHTAGGLDAWRAAVAIASRRCIKVCDVNLRKSADPSPDEQAAAREGIAHAEVVKLNDRECGILASWFGWSDPIAELQQRVRVVALTHGARGATLYGAGEPIEIAGSLARPGGDNVGCGDAFVAIFVHAMTLGWDLRTCGETACRWAAAVAEARGATPRFGTDCVAELLGEEQP